MICIINQPIALSQILLAKGYFYPQKIVEDNFLEFALGKVCRTNSMCIDEGSALEVLIRPDDIQHVDAGTTTAIV